MKATAVILIMLWWALRYPKEKRNGLRISSSTSDDQKWRNEERIFRETQICIAKKLNRITVFTGFVGLGGLVILFFTLTYTRKAFIHEQKPIIWITRIDQLQIIVGQPIVWTFHYDNFGKSAALGFMSRGR
jgi:hypothetical protein